MMSDKLLWWLVALYCASYAVAVSPRGEGQPR